MTRWLYIIINDGTKASDLIRRGIYNWVHDDITDNSFPIAEHSSRARTIELLGFDHDMQSVDVLAEFYRLKRERPTYEDALTFGKDYPQVQTKNIVAFLHEPVQIRNDYGIIVLDGNNRKRTLDILRPAGKWSKQCLFAAVIP